MHLIDDTHANPTLFVVVFCLITLNGLRVEKERIANTPRSYRVVPNVCLVFIWESIWKSNPCVIVFNWDSVVVQMNWCPRREMRIYS